MNLFASIKLIINFYYSNSNEFVLLFIYANYSNYYLKKKRERKKEREKNKNNENM